MKKGKILLISITCLLICTLLAGCAGEAAQTESGSVAGQAGGSGTIGVMELSAKKLEAPQGMYSPSAKTIAGGANDFAFRLSALLVAEAGTENFVCSPFSVWIPLAALVNATDDSSRESLLAALSAAGISDEDINSAASRMLYELTRQMEKDFAEKHDGYTAHDPLRIANAIFVGNNVTLKTDFAQAFLDYYRGSAMTVDFSSSEAVDAVNRWASENTEGFITEIIKEFDPDTVAAIANAIYFSDKWSWEFNPDKTKEDIFHSPAGDMTASFMLREGDGLTYYEDDQIQAMPLNFSTGGGLYIILPKDGDATGLLSSMTNDRFSEIQRNSIGATGKLLLPRFSIESGIMDLKDALVALGVPLFDESTAPLTGGLIEENIPVWLSKAVQKAVINVDEKGTTAAAVTVMAAAGGGAMRPDPTVPFEMNCNKPFVFILYSHTYDGGSQVLFTGVVNQTR